MKILVVGVGIIGTIYGWALSEGGHAVTHLVRPGKTRSVAGSVDIDMLDGRKGHRNTVTPYTRKIVENATEADGFDLVVVPTKPYQLHEVVTALAPTLPTARFLLLTQNWTGTAEIDAVLPRSRYLFGDAHAGGIYKGNLLVATIFKDIVLGDIDGNAPDVLREFGELFRSADITVTTPQNILHYIWVQYAINAGLWTGLVHCGNLQALLHDKVIGAASLRAVNECLAVTAARRVDLKLYPDTTVYTMARSRLGMIIAGLMVKAMFTFNAKVKRASAHGLGDPREITTAYQALLASGEELGVEMPAMESFRADMNAFAVHRW